MKKSKIIIVILIVLGILVYTNRNNLMNRFHSMFNMGSMHNMHNMNSNNNTTHNMGTDSNGTHNMGGDNTGTHNMGGYGSMHMHGARHEDPVNANVKKFTRALLIPPLFEGTVKNGVREFELTAMEGEWNLIDGKKTKTFGYSSPILSPTLLLNNNEETKITLTNNLKEVTTVHWHGAIVGEKVDGVHNSDIMPGTSREIAFKLNQPAATLWFHPHTHSKTASQVYKGMAGFLYLQDEKSESLGLPTTYGIDDIPIVVQEKILDKNNQIVIESSQMEITHGKMGGYMMVNGVIAPTFTVPKGIIRLRLLNGSNATHYTYSFEGEEFYQIASDGGLLEKPIHMTKLELGPGERAEILIDTSKINRTFYMIVNENKALEVRIDEKKSDNIEIVKKMPTFFMPGLDTISDEILKSDILTRKFTLSSEMNKNVINGKLFDMSRIDFTVEKDTYEIWEITNSIGGINMPHPFHVHGTQFRVIERNGQMPPENERGFKDTVNLNAGDTVKILIKFKNKGISVYHCHILEHEDNGMMGQFEVK